MIATAVCAIAGFAQGTPSDQRMLHRRAVCEFLTAVGVNGSHHIQNVVNKNARYYFFKRPGDRPKDIDYDEPLTARSFAELSWLCVPSFQSETEDTVDVFWRCGGGLGTSFAFKGNRIASATTLPMPIAD